MAMGWEGNREAVLSRLRAFIASGGGRKGIYSGRHGERKPQEL